MKKSNRYEREIKSLKEIIEHEKLIHSNSLIILNSKDERRITLAKVIQPQNINEQVPEKTPK
jgi:hypothetical protein